MSENMKAFLDAVQNNKELEEKFKGLGSKEQEEYIDLAKEYGITLTKEDFDFDEEELTDEELANVAGGVLTLLDSTSKLKLQGED